MNFRLGINTKRKQINNKIFTLLLITNSQHKYKKYLPKQIIKLMLSFMYNIDYMKIHKNIITDIIPKDMYQT